MDEKDQEKGQTEPQEQEPNKDNENELRAENEALKNEMKELRGSVDNLSKAFLSSPVNSTKKEERTFESLLEDIE